MKKHGDTVNSFAQSGSAASLWQSGGEIWNDYLIITLDATESRQEKLSDSRVFAGRFLACASQTSIDIININVTSCYLHLFQQSVSRWVLASCSCELNLCSTKLTNDQTSVEFSFFHLKSKCLSNLFRYRCLVSVFGPCCFVCPSLA